MFYKLIEDGRFWSVDEAVFVEMERVPPDAQIVALNDLEQLAKCLREYGFPLGEMADMNDLQNQFTDAIQTRLDEFARTRNYDDILSAATYATSAIPKFKAEGQYAVEARDATWTKGYEILGEVQVGQRPMPTLEEVFAELPSLAWPD